MVNKGVLEPLEPLERMELLLSLLPYLKEQRLLGDQRAADTVFDLEKALEDAALTPKQRAAVELIMFKGFSYRDAAEVAGVHFTTLAEHGQAALEKILAEYKKGDGEND